MERFSSDTNSGKNRIFGQQNVLYGIFHDHTEKTKIFDAIWADIKFLRTVKLFTEGKNFFIGHDLEKEIFSKFSDFFDSDKKLKNFSFDELSIINDYLTSLFQKLLVSMDVDSIKNRHNRDYIEKHLDHKLESQIVPGDFGPSLCCMEGVEHMKKEINNSSYPSKKPGLNEYELYEETNSDNHAEVYDN